ncbi:MAG: peptidoglycan DD-metalloendopeptidase family protein [Rhizobiales bacterium]|nr:peptidoglycan DD-metalloendopeptidase family protein [Hyphomicrobiales bacterium]
MTIFRVVLVALIVGMAGAAQAAVSLKGTPEQGALMIGQTEPGAKVTIDGRSLMVSQKGYFAFGFDRDHGPKATLVVTTPDGVSETKSLAVAARDYDIQRINGIAPKYVSPPAETLKRIAKEREMKKRARPADTPADWFAETFIWPAKGPISGVYGSQRIFNGEPRRPHFGLDIAAPKGAPVVAPADGIVRLANPDMYFEGGLVFIDHGQGVSTYYMHLSKIDVKPGQSVRQGDVIGAVGSTGRATGPHLHWGMSWLGTPLDPQLMVKDTPQ